MPSIISAYALNLNCNGCPLHGEQVEDMLMYDNQLLHVCKQL